MLNVGTLSGPVWRIAPSGCARVFFVRRCTNNTAEVCSRGHRGAWSTKPMVVALADLFATEDEARVEYSVRKLAALQRDPAASLNLTTPLQEA